jgi:hypothetical protein
MLALGESDQCQDLPIPREEYEGFKKLLGISFE